MSQQLSTDVLVVGAGGAGMYAALEAARRGASVILADRSLIGRGGATVMAQMTVAVALDDEGLDHWEHHYADTLKAGLAGATAAEVAPLRTVRLDTDAQPADLKLDGPALWRRSEPGTSDALAGALAADLADWSRACAG